MKHKWFLLGAAAGAAAAVPVLLYWRKQREQTKELEERDVAKEENEQISALIAEHPQMYSGLYMGLYQSAREQWGTWANWFRVWKQRTVQAKPEMAQFGIFEPGFFPETAQDTAAVARRLLECVKTAGVRMCPIEEMEDGNQAFMLSSGENIPEGVACHTVVPAFLWNDEVIEYGTAEARP